MWLELKAWMSTGFGAVFLGFLLGTMVMGILEICGVLEMVADSYEDISVVMEAELGLDNDNNCDEQMDDDEWLCNDGVKPACGLPQTNDAGPCRLTIQVCNGTDWIPVTPQ